VPSSTTSSVARRVPSVPDADVRQRSGGLVGGYARRSSSGSLLIRHLLGPQAASGRRTTDHSVVRFYTTVQQTRERAGGVEHVSTLMKEWDARPVCRKADTMTVRRRLPDSVSEWAWSRARGAVSRGGLIGPLRETAPPAAAHGGVAGDHRGAVFCQVGTVAPARPLASAWCGRPALLDGTRRCQD